MFILKTRMGIYMCEYMIGQFIFERIFNKTVKIAVSGKRKWVIRGLHLEKK